MTSETVKPLIHSSESSAVNKDVIHSDGKGILDRLYICDIHFVSDR